MREMRNAKCRSLARLLLPQGVVVKMGEQSAAAVEVDAGGGLDEEVHPPVGNRRWMRPGQPPDLNSFISEVADPLHFTVLIALHRRELNARAPPLAALHFTAQHAALAD